MFAGIQFDRNVLCQIRWYLFAVKQLKLIKLENSCTVVLPLPIVSAICYSPGNNKTYFTSAKTSNVKRLVADTVTTVLT